MERLTPAEELARGSLTLSYLKSDSHPLPTDLEGLRTSNARVDTADRRLPHEQCMNPEVLPNTLMLRCHLHHEWKGSNHGRCEMAPSTHGTAVACMNDGCPNKMKLAKSEHRWGRCFLGPIPYGGAISSWHLLRERKTILLWGRGGLAVSHASVDCPTSHVVLSRRSKKKPTWSWEERVLGVTWWEGRKEEETRYDHLSLYTYMKFLKNIKLKKLFLRATYQNSGESNILIFMKRKTQMSKFYWLHSLPVQNGSLRPEGCWEDSMNISCLQPTFGTAAPPHPIPQITENPAMVAIPWENVIKTCTTRALFCFLCSLLAALGSIQLHPSNPTPMLLNHYVNPNAWRGHQ